MELIRYKHAINRPKLGGMPAHPRSVAQQTLLGLTWFVFVLIGAIGFGSPAFGRAMDIEEAAILRQVAPAVVSISVWKMRASDQPGEPSRRVKTYGSGFIVDPSGIIVTNQHVIDSAIDVKAVLIDGTRVSAKVLAASPMTDLAVLKIEVDHPLPSLAWGDSEALQVGDPVLTLGNGLGLGTSVSAGIVSGLNRNFADSPFDSYIQTDAVINHGNSGGPLIDRDGKVVGVSEALINPEGKGGFIGVGLAIPTTIAKFVTDRLVDPRHPPPGWLGFNLQDVTPELAEPLGAPRSMGAIVAAVEPSGPASQASLQPGDVLDQVNGQKLDDSRAFMRAIAILPPGQIVHLAVWRHGHNQDVPATVAAWPNYKPNGGAMTGQAAAEMMTRPPDLGVKLALLDDMKRRQYGLGPEISGVLVAHVDADSEASDLGLQEGDVVMVVQTAAVVTPDDVHRAVRDAQEQHRTWLAVLIRTRSGPQWIPISISTKSS
jgi:serine protease Do